jgi:predicted transcriptional regulator
MPQEAVARAVARYNLLAIPVVNSIGQLVGIVTIDDVVDVIREENTEDYVEDGRHWSVGYNVPLYLSEYASAFAVAARKFRRWALGCLYHRYF